MSGGSGGHQDLRLAGTATGCWLAALVGLRIPAVASGATAAVSLAAAVAVILFTRCVATGAGRHQRVTGTAGGADRSGPVDQVDTRRPSATMWESLGWITAAALFGIAIGATVTGLRVGQRDAQPLAGLARHQETVRVRLTVGDDPRPLRSARTADTVLVPARLSRVAAGDNTWIPTAARVLVIASGAGWSHLLPGQQIESEGRLASAKGGDLTTAVLYVQGDAALVAPAPWYQRAAGGLRAGLRRACVSLPPEPAGLLPGLVVGDTSRLDSALAEDFRATGMTHLVAVSGSNCAIMVGAVLLLTRWCRCGPRISAGVCLLALVGFVILARPSPSVLRAAVMGGIALFGLAAGRKKAAVPALAATVVVLVVADPALAVDAGFALSVLATAGLLLLAPGWAAALRRRRVPAGVAEALAVPVAAQVTCAPVIAALSATISLTAVPANLLAAPAVAPATMLGVAATLLSPVWSAGSQYLAWLGSWPARWLIWLAHSGAAVPAGLLPWRGGISGGLLLALVVLGAGLVARVGLVRFALARRMLAAAALAAVLGALPVRIIASGWPPHGWFFVACDVGQGDALVLSAGPGQAVVVDTGPDPAAVGRCLRGLGIERIVLLFLTHGHADHIGGVSGVTRGRRVGTVITSEGCDPGGAGSAMRSAVLATGAPVAVATAGVEYTVGLLRLVVLAPLQRLTGTRSDANNNSLVVRAELGGRAVLLAGDAEVEEQSTVLAGTLGGRLRADVLKVAHHGSAYQDGAFLQAVSPAAAVVSVGRGNTLGHPHSSVLAQLSGAGARIMRTDQVGDVAVTVDRHGRLAVVTHRAVQAGRSV